jgi:hypothetical protein
MMTVKEILDQKGHQAWTISPGAKVLDALKLMAEKGSAPWSSSRTTRSWASSPSATTPGRSF